MNEINQGFMKEYRESKGNLNSRSAIALYGEYVQGCQRIKSEPLTLDQWLHQRWQFEQVEY